MEFYPFFHIQNQCEISLFHPSVYPWFNNPPVEPAGPPEEPSMSTQDSLVQEALEFDDSEVTAFLGDATHVETELVRLENSLQYMTAEEQREFEHMIRRYQENDEFDMRNSNAFEVNDTKGRIDPDKRYVPERESYKGRKSMKWRHIDLKLDAHKNHIMENKRGGRVSENPK